jgi:hypothetical protein
MADTAAVSKEISKKLRAYEGLTAAKLADCPAILDALGTTDPAEAYKRFVAAVESLPEDRYTDALKSALRLDPTLPAGLTGGGGRRVHFGEKHFVGDGAVKLWEARAIETLAAALTAPSAGAVDVIHAVYIVDKYEAGGSTGARISTETIFRRWTSADGRTSRHEKEEHVNNSEGLSMWALYQVQHDEHLSELLLDLIFAKDETPTGFYAFGGVNLFELSNHQLQPLKVQGPKPAADVIPRLEREEGGENVIGDYVSYSCIWTMPEPLKFYGVRWVYKNSD